MSKIEIEERNIGKIRITFPFYNPPFVSKIKSVQGYKWYPEEKYWSLPNLNGMVEKILRIFKGEKIHIDSVLQSRLFFGIARSEARKPSDEVPVRTKAVAIPLRFLTSLVTSFEDLKCELTSRKYSYKIIKSYIYYNRELLNYTCKSTADINECDMKNYIFYLSEEKQPATSTLNQAINALKFYYGTVQKKNFVYEVKRPCKDKKLPILLSKEEVEKVPSSIDNIKHKAVLMLMYSTGLRVGKVVKLRLEDIDSKSMLIHIAGTKGKKD